MHHTGGKEITLHLDNLQSGTGATEQTPSPPSVCVRRDGGGGALRRPRPRSGGRNEFSSDTGSGRSCAAARGADVAARRPYQAQHIPSVRWRRGGMPGAPLLLPAPLPSRQANGLLPTPASRRQKERARSKRFARFRPRNIRVSATPHCFGSVRRHYSA